MKRSQVAFLHLTVDFVSGLGLDFAASLVGRDCNEVDVVNCGDGVRISFGDSGFGELEVDIGSLFSVRLILVSKNLRRGEHEGVDVLPCFDSSLLPPE